MAPPPMDTRKPFATLLPELYDTEEDAYDFYIKNAASLALINFYNPDWYDRNKAVDRMHFFVEKLGKGLDESKDISLGDAGQTTSTKANIPAKPSPSNTRVSSSNLPVKPDTPNPDISSANLPVQPAIPNLNVSSAMFSVIQAPAPIAQTPAPIVQTPTPVAQASVPIVQALVPTPVAAVGIGSQQQKSAKTPRFNMETDKVIVQLLLENPTISSNELLMKTNRATGRHSSSSRVLLNRYRKIGNKTKNHWTVVDIKKSPRWPIIQSGANSYV